jgi:hypothetical protein
MSLATPVAVGVCALIGYRIVRAKLLDVDDRRAAYADWPLHRLTKLNAGSPEQRELAQIVSSDGYRPPVSVTGPEAFHTFTRAMCTLDTCRTTTQNRPIRVVRIRGQDTRTLDDLARELDAQAFVSWRRSIWEAHYDDATTRVKTAFDWLDRIALQRASDKHVLVLDGFTRCDKQTRHVLAKHLLALTAWQVLMVDSDISARFDEVYMQPFTKAEVREYAVAHTQDKLTPVQLAAFTTLGGELMSELLDMCAMVQTTGFDKLVEQCAHRVRADSMHFRRMWRVRRGHEIERKYVCAALQFIITKPPGFTLLDAYNAADGVDEGIEILLKQGLLYIDDDGGIRPSSNHTAAVLQELAKTMCRK